MPREEYNRFIAAWNEVSPEGYILQNKENAPAFPHSFTKIRKKHTTFLEKRNDVKKFYTGIFIDVFPVDRAPTGKIGKTVFYAECMLYQLFTREFVPPKAGNITQLGSAAILTLIRGKSRAKARETLLHSLTEHNGDTARETVLFDTITRMKQFYSHDFFDSFVLMDFEGGSYPGMIGWDEYLTKLYGDYMTLPPESERTWKHHPIILDFEHDYEELHQTDPDRFP
jgi:lipopolysaccharide cholinephosphotransferase